MKPITPDRETARHYDKVAAELSALPGLGQFYKGHYVLACGFALLDGLLALLLVALFSLAYALGAFMALFGFAVDWIGLLFNPVTLWCGLMPLLLLWTLAACDAFEEPDLRHQPLRRRYRAITPSSLTFSAKPIGKED